METLLKWFLRCQGANAIYEETGVSKYMVLKALSLVRQSMETRNISEVFEGIVEVDETCLRNIQ